MFGCAGDGCAGSVMLVQLCWFGLAGLVVPVWSCRFGCACLLVTGKFSLFLKTEKFSLFVF